MSSEREEGENNKQEARQEAQEESKKPYESPRLLKFGSVEELTGPAFS